MVLLWIGGSLELALTVPLISRDRYRRSSPDQWQGLQYNLLHLLQRGVGGEKVDGEEGLVGSDGTYRELIRDTRYTLFGSLADL